MATTCFAIAAFSASIYAMKVAYCGIVYLSLGCCPKFNKFVNECKKVIEKEFE